MRFFLLVTIVALTGCSHFSPTGVSIDGREADIDLPIAYRCNSGNIVRASYPSTTMAAVQYEGRMREMTIAVSGSGARYVGNGLEWWTKGAGPGSSATLFRHEKDGTTGNIVESCIQLHTGG